MRISCNLDKRTKRHAYDLTTKITEDTKSFNFSSLKGFVTFVFFIVIKVDQERANLHAAHRSYSCRTRLRICADSSAVRGRSSIRARQKIRRRTQTILRFRPPAWRRSVSRPTYVRLPGWPLPAR